MAELAQKLRAASGDSTVISPVTVSHGSSEIQAKETTAWWATTEACPSVVYVPFLITSCHKTYGVRSLVPFQYRPEAEALTASTRPRVRH